MLAATEAHSPNGQEEKGGREGGGQGAGAGGRGGGGTKTQVHVSEDTPL